VNGPITVSLPAGAGAHVSAQNMSGGINSDFGRSYRAEKGNKLTRPLMEKTLGIDAHAELPKFVSRTFVSRDKSAPLTPNASARWTRPSTWIMP